MAEQSQIQYSEIISLGGNCSAASQLKQRNLRIKAMPFDYFFLRNNEDLEKFIESLKNDFKNCFLKENFRELEKHERGGSDLFQYQDMVSGFNIIHMFHNSINTNNEYENVKTKIDKRLARFYNCCCNAKSICFIMAVDFDAEDKLIYKLSNIINEKFPNKSKLIFVSMNSNEDSIVSANNLDIKKFKRKINMYDYIKTNFEWNFLDNLSLENEKTKKNNYFLKIIKEKRGFTIHLLNYFSTLLHFKAYILGLKLNICIGRLRK